MIYWNKNADAFFLVMFFLIIVVFTLVLCTA